MPIEYNFGEGVAAEEVATLTQHATELGLAPEAAPKFAAFYTSQSKAHAEALAKASAPAVPEQYEFDPVDGKPLDEALTKELSETAKALGLTAEQAKKYAAHELSLRKEANAADAERMNKLKTVQDGWKAELAKDPEIGGAKFDESKATVKTALEKFFPDVAKNEAGFPFLDHPAVFKGLLTIGKALGVDGDFVRNPGKGGGAEDPAKLLYPTMFTK